MRRNSGDRGQNSGDRGQAYALEGIASALLLLIAVIYALQSVVVTPTTPGTLDHETRAELSTQADDVLAAASNNDSLRAIALYWNTSSTLHNRTFSNPTPDERSVDPGFGYGQHDLPGELGAMLNQTFSQRGLSYNVFVRYRLNDSVNDWTETDRVVLVKRGVPTDNAVSSTYTFTLYDSMRLTSPSSDKTLVGEDRFYAPDIDPNGPVYNIVTVRLVVW